MGHLHFEGEEESTYPGCGPPVEDYIVEAELERI